MPNKGRINLLLKVFAMFQLCLFYDKHYEEGNAADAIAIRFRNCNKETGLHLKDTPIE